MLQNRQLRCQPGEVLLGSLPRHRHALPLSRALHDSRRTQPASPGIASHKTEEGDGRAPQELWFPAELVHVVVQHALVGMLSTSRSGTLSAICCPDNTNATGPLSPDHVAGSVLPCTSQPCKDSCSDISPPAAHGAPGHVECRHSDAYISARHHGAAGCSQRITVHCPQARDTMPPLSPTPGPTTICTKSSHGSICQPASQAVCSHLSKQTFLSLL